VSVKRHYNPEVAPVAELLRGLWERPGAADVVIEKPGFRLELRRRRAAG